MLQGNQFEMNEAWIAFKLNDAPIQTELDGDLNCIALMDAASGIILGIEFFAVSAGELSEAGAHRLLQAGQSRNQRLPRTLVIPQEQKADAFAEEAASQDLMVARVPEQELLAFIGEARVGFRARFGGRSQ